jgi:hypothetical protein
VNGRIPIVRTEDGERWLRADGPVALLGEGAFAASNTSLTLGPNGHAWLVTGVATIARVHHSADWGVTWRAVDTPLLGGPSAGLFGAAFVSPSVGYAIGGDYLLPWRNTALLRTSTGGAAWERVPLAPPNGYASGIIAAGTQVIAVGEGGAAMLDARTTRWRSLSTQPANALSCAATRCWTVGSRGRISTFALPRE